MNGQITIGSLMAFMLVTNVLYRPITIIVSMILSFNDTKASVIRLREYYDNSVNADELLGRKETVIDQNPDIVFNNVSFTYPLQENKILSSMSFTIPFGKFVAIVGDNGAGKSTIFKLISKFYSQQQGTISIGGADIKNISTNTLRDYVHYNYQNMSLFSSTVLENITYGIKSSYDKKDLLNFIKMTESNFINKLPLGINSPVSSDGKTLSGGECQKINFIRALLKSPKIYLLDEPTSNMDGISQNALIQIINQIKGKSSVILITHNEELIRNAEIILRIENGNLVMSSLPIAS